MEITPYIESIRRDLAVAAEVAGADARAAAERLTAALDAAVRLALMEALSTAAEEITRDLAPGSVEVRLRGRNPEFVVTPPPGEPEIPTPPEPPIPPVPPMPEGEQGTARVTLRLPEPLKARAEEAAAREGISVNTWLVRAVSAALAEPPPERRAPRGPSSRVGPHIGQRLTGWAR
ncbi:toxin-antitoxin system HicB family antitoxin [Actinopolymorpha alba]|uniref:toxin-antitoxin system HicB family antitoxin n=1 Tax=Actinopolymorpha alba TaxID=533267 RepID=UPI0003754B08|nr:toxin-antitoxin system HicB family antitoxin [Actinopolymorpha alba]